jgi:hypothetical protein
LLAFERDRRRQRGKFQLENRSEDDSKEQRADAVVNEERDAYDNGLVTPLNDDMTNMSRK